MANKTSQHILGTSANLLGFCLFVITSLHIANKSEGSLIDEFTSIVALFLTISSVFSFISIKTEDKQREKKFELLADYLFIISLIGVFGIILFIIVNFWSKITDSFLLLHFFIIYYLYSKSWTKKPIISLIQFHSINIQELTVYLDSF
ncbi:MAG: hypothetical protein PHS59_08760 [Paludibacter sp.]|nr:hypothetical protein [Paludibacter sp.]